jgi:hypothetical protein
MSQSGMRLARLAAIRKLNEDLDRRNLQLALASVAEVEAGLARQQAALAESKAVAVAALSDGNRREWLMSEAQSEVAGWNRNRLRVILESRTGAVAPAMAKFLESRQKHEQAKQLLRNARQSASIEDDRKAQSAADDWFLNRRARPRD